MKRSLCSHKVKCTSCFFMRFDCTSLAKRLHFSCTEGALNWKSTCKCKCFFLAPPVGLEPTTLRLTAACSTDWAKEECYYRPVLVGGNLCRRRLIFPGGCPPSIVSTSELNYRVRNGNGWTLIVIGTDSIFNAFNVKSIYILHRFRAVFFGDPYGIRTHVAGVRGRSLRPLDQRAVWYTFRDSNPGHPD